MKKIFTTLSLAALSALPSHASELLAGWDFNDATGATTLNAYNASNGAQKNVAGLLVGGTNASSNLIEPSGPPTLNTGERTISGAGSSIGTSFLFTDNTDGFTSFSTTNNKEFQLFGNKATTSLNGKSVVFAFSTTGWAGISLQLVAERASGGPNNNSWAWSTDGSSFNSIQTGWNPATSFATFSLDLSGITALDNKATVFLQLTMGGQTGTTGTTNYLKFDNVQVGGATPVVPEPSTWAALAGAAALGAALLRRRARVA